VVDVKLKGRVDKAQSFAKAVILSLFLLISVGLYTRWDSIMELSGPKSVQMSVVVVDDKSNGETSQLRVDKNEQFMKEMSELKARLHPKLLSTPHAKKELLSGGKDVPVLTEEDKVNMNHPKKEVYLPIASKMKEVNKKNIAKLRSEVGNDKKDVPLKAITTETATKTQMTVVPTKDKQISLLTGAAKGKFF